MKIELDLMTTSGVLLLTQMKVVDEYIKNFGKITKNRTSLVEYDEYDIRETGKHDGFAIGEKLYVGGRFFHVSCNKTKGGTYKFKIWNA